VTSYPTPKFTRPALAPGVLATIALLAGAALVDSDAFLWVRFVVSILALIVCVFAVQAKAYWWIAGFAPIAIAWNPVVPLPWEGLGWLAAQFVAAFVFIAAGVLLTVRNPEDRNRRR
jgi:hypothetical protein